MSFNEIEKKRYTFGGINLSSIRNRNEARVIRLLPVVIASFPDYEPDILAIQDIYALALNSLPARYTQQFSIILCEPVDDGRIRDALHKAIEKVRANPISTDNGEPAGT